MVTAKLTKVGGATAVILPDDVVERLNLDKASTVGLVEDDGGYRLTWAEPTKDDQLTMAQEIMERRWAALRELAK
jgi:putative addiction module antidote